MSLAVLLHLSAAAAAPKRVAVLTLESSGVDSSLGATATALIPTEIRRVVPSAEVLGPDEISSMVGVERQRQLAGGAAGEGLKELGRSLNADEVVSGRIGALGSTVVVELHRADTAQARVIRSATRTVDANGDAVADAVRELVSDVYGLGLDDSATVARHTRGAIFGGVGVVLLAAGVVGIVHVQSDVSAYNAQQGHPESATVTRAGAKTDQWLWPTSIAVGVVGLAGAIFGGYQLFTKAPSVVPTVNIVQGGGSLALTGTF